MYARDPWVGPLEICHDDSPTDDGRIRNMDLDRAALPRTLDETRQGWLLAAPRERKKKRYVDLGCLLVSRKLFVWTIGVLLAAAVIAGIGTGIAEVIPKRQRAAPPPDKYTVALRKALMFFNAQKSGKLPEDNNITWRGDSCLKDGQSSLHDLSGGYYDAGDAVKFNFPAAFSMTLLSWSVIEYSAKYDAAGELGHVRDTIKWGADYLLKTFNSTADTIDALVAQVGSAATAPGSSQPNDQYCWMRPEEIDYARPVVECQSCPDLAAEMAAALAAASIVFKDDRAYSRKLLHGATTVWNFASDRAGSTSYSPPGSDAAEFYNSTRYYDELLWGGSWMYLATGNSSYLHRVIDSNLAKQAGAFSAGKDHGVFSWDNKLPGAQLLMSRLWLFLSPGYPYEDMLRTFQSQTSIIMCSYLPVFKSFNRTKGGLIQLNHGMPQPLQYVANAAFLASVYSDYLEAADTPGWNCGPDFYSVDVLRSFATTQIEYILGENPLKMSYVVGYGENFPKRVHHRGASIPKKGGDRGCTGGWRWRDSKAPNPNVIAGAMVAGPDGHDGFKDVRKNRNYTEATLAGNAGLVAALVALSGDDHGLDKNTMFSAVPSMFPSPPPPPAPWKPVR